MELFGTTGQERRQWLDQKADGFANMLSYYLGPTGIPERLGAGANLLAYTDAGDMVEAADASRSLWNDPSLANAARYTAAGTAMALPFIGARGVNELSNNAIDWMADESGAIRAWHGSPHDFDRFSMDKIGTGEGAQAYGHGLYFAERKGIAEDYRRRLASFKETAEEGVTSVMRFADGDRQKAAELARQGLETTTRNNFDDGGAQVAKWQEILRLIEDPSVDVTQFKPPGRLYEVEINANPEDFLDWDAPLSAQPEIARRLGVDPNANARRAAEIRASVADEMRLDGRAEPDQIDMDRLRIAEELEALEMTGNASSLAPRSMQQIEEMRAAGIPGIRYLDAGSRGAGDGSRNYVVFDDELISILKKYGIAGVMAGGAVGGMTQQEQY
jgi:hypothetical protein